MLAIFGCGHVIKKQLEKILEAVRMNAQCTLVNWKSDENTPIHKVKWIGCLEEENRKSHLRI